MVPSARLSHHWALQMGRGRAGRRPRGSSGTNLVLLEASAATPEVSSLMRNPAEDGKGSSWFC